MGPDLLLPVLILGCTIRLTWVDFRRFEIETPTLVLMGGALLLESLLYRPPGDVVIRTISALAFYGVLVVMIRTAPRLSRIGAGDPPLIGVIAFMVTPWLVPWAMLSGVLILATSARYSVIRGKPLLKSMFPAAPPLLGAAAPIYLFSWHLG